MLAALPDGGDGIGLDRQLGRTAGEFREARRPGFGPERGPESADVLWTVCVQTGAETSDRCRRHALSRERSEYGKPVHCISRTDIQRQPKHTVVSRFELLLCRLPIQSGERTARLPGPFCRGRLPFGNRVNSSFGFAGSCAWDRNDRIAAGRIGVSRVPIPHHCILHFDGGLRAWRSAATPTLLRAQLTRNSVSDQ